MNAVRFLDTNILVYALDLDAGLKRQSALRLIETGWQELGETALSVQVLQELHVNLLRRGRSVVEATQIVRDFYHWPVVENTLPLLDDALDIQARWQLSLWDALIVAAGRASGASELLTEDLSHGQDYGGIRTWNPFVQTFKPTYQSISRLTPSRPASDAKERLRTTRPGADTAQLPTRSSPASPSTHRRATCGGNAPSTSLAAKALS